MHRTLPMRYLLTLFLFGGLLATVFAPVARAQQEDVVDEIVAQIGDRIVLRSDVDATVLRAMQQQRMSYSEALWLDALNQLIDQNVLTIQAQRDTNIVVGDDQLEQVLSQRIEQVTAQVGGSARMEEIYGKTTREIRADLREELRDQLLAEQLQGQKLQTIKITPSEVTDWFTQFTSNPADTLPVIPEVVRLSHIVRYPAVTDEARQEALEIITAIRDSVVSGGSTLEEMATLFSDDVASAPSGGRYEDSKLGDLVPEFAAVAARAAIDQVSQVFESPYGYHILRVNSRTGDNVDFNHVLIQLDDDKADPSEAIDFLTTIRDSIETSSLPFALMARRHSEEESTKNQGGRVVDPRTAERDLVLQELGLTWRQNLSSLEEGEISEPAEVELLDGTRAYHIVLLQRRIPQHRVDLQTDYARIEQLALQAKQGRVMRRWLDGLRKDIYIEVRGKAEEISVAAKD